RQVVTDEGLFREATFARLESLQEDQDEAFASLGNALAQHGERLDEALSRLDGRLGALTDQVEQLAKGINRLLAERQLRQRPLSAGDSLSVRDEGEAQFIRQLIGRYRALPAEQRRLWPELLGGVGKLGMMEGSFQAAERDFRELAALEANPAARAEAHY